MLISAREACEILADAGVSRRCALQVLQSGLAGDVVQGRRVALYDDANVRDLARRRRVRWPDFDDEYPGGFFVSRRAFPATGAREDQLAALAGGWGAVSPWTWFALTWQVHSLGAVPFIATVGGLAAFGADIVGARAGSRFLFGPPGPWFAQVEGCWFPTGRGRSWMLHLGPLRPEGVDQSKIPE